MNKDTPDDDAAIRYYDSDYPSLEIGEPRAEHVVQLERMGILGDVGFYKELAARVSAEAGGPVLEIGCGTGRLTIPLARLGLEVWAVDVSAGMLVQLRAKLAREAPAVQARVRIVQQDAAQLDLPERGFALALLPFNTLMLIPDPDEERAALAAIAAHMAPGATLAFDVMNPPTLTLEADRTSAPTEPRTAPDTGNRYVRYGMNTGLDARRRQRVCGWYDELLPGGTVHSSDFAFHWRMIFHAELEPMLREAGFAVETLAGDFEGTAWTPASRRMVVTARRC
jgi:SAM-dependent methyltransferase